MPGGGAAAGLGAALGAALLAMAAGFTTGERFPEADARMASYVGELEVLRRAALATVEEDAAAYGEVVAAYRLPKGTEAERSARQVAVREALVAAAGPPVALGRVCHHLTEIAADVARAANPTLVADVGTGVSFVSVALETCRLNVDANTAHLPEGSLEPGLAGDRAAMDDDLAVLASALATVRSRLDRS